MKLKEIFSRQSWLLSLALVVGLGILSFGAWWVIRSALHSDIETRLNAEADRIEAVFNTRINTYTNSLFYTRAYFYNVSEPTSQQFDSYLASVDLQRRYPGSRGIGFARLVSHDNVARLLEQLKKEHPAARFRPEGERPLSFIVSLLEPVDFSSKTGFGYDMVGEVARKEAVEMAIQTGQPIITKPVLFNRDYATSMPVGFVIYLPVYKNPYFVPDAKTPPDFSKVTGVIFAPLGVRDLFEGAFGAPSLAKESVNFTIKTRGDNSKAGFDTYYDRFDLDNNLPSSLWLNPGSQNRVERDLHILGRTLVLSVMPLPHFYTFTDYYLAPLVGLSALLISILIFWVLQSVQEKLRLESLAKTASLEAQKNVAEQAEIMKRLNDFARAISKNLEIHPIIEHFVHSLKEADVDVMMFYFSSSNERRGSLPLHDYYGIGDGERMRPSVDVKQLQELLGGSMRLMKAESGDLGKPSRIFCDVDFSDWILMDIPSKQSPDGAYILIGRRNYRFFSSREIEFFDNLVSQFAIGVDNAKLFSKAEDANESKGAFLANMSHEIRTPLNAILGFSEMLLLDDISLQQKSSVASNLQKNSQQLTRIIDDILDLSKVEAGKIYIERSKVNLASVIHEVKSVMDMRAQARNIHFSVECLSKVPEQIITDEVRLKQILMNLLGNAIKFTEKGDVKLIMAASKSAEGQIILRFLVEDTGIGIAEEDQGQLFSPFSQGDNSKTRQFGGSGLGLALSRRLARELGGDIVLLKSVQGQGSLFEVTVNCGDLGNVAWSDRLTLEDPSESKVEKKKIPRLDGVSLLLVEDSEDNQDIFKHFLVNYGASVDIVEDGLQAVDQATLKDYDAILMDIQIPTIDGKEATRRIRRKGYDNPIIALTAHAMVEERESCLQAGCNGQITKPVSGEELITLVGEYLGRS